MMTVVFRLDLSGLPSGACQSQESTAIRAIQESIARALPTEPNIQFGHTATLVLELPKNAQAFGDLLYWSRFGKLPYQTLWLNAAGEWA